ncbi:TetR/AcrR family transcriptional regulator [Amycolatopsis rhabdoformis]|uniref:TetR/AcrR family transcriptional regulator n=1 Tax=Amycolatopsis rhabdoformis TaxID=1448059 RepID=A0ABZ1IC33_9PSEU|nr:TetR/AcrR family transcriptional regulator [Amycolatopsis rhabdoformis]WSE31286.1 TetR/AcrR family transcriptional regulator [Amycolatopsis rhabdoformis]
MAGRRLSREQRQLQLLDTAAEIVRTEGADSLTLARVAERAGVTKPITYGHFETRTGLLKALYQRIDQQQTDAARASLEVGADTLEAAATVLARFYVECVLHIGREFGPVTAALATTPDMEEILRAGRERYAEAFLAAVRRFVELPDAEGKPLLLGVVGAAETLSREVVAGRLGTDRAIDSIARIITGAVRPS